MVGLSRGHQRPVLGASFSCKRRAADLIPAIRAFHRDVQNPKPQPYRAKRDQPTLNMCLAWSRRFGPLLVRMPGGSDCWF